MDAASLLTQRQELLWMSLGMYLGLFALSIIVGGLDKARGGLQQQNIANLLRIETLESDLRESRRQVTALRRQVTLRDGVVLSQGNDIAALQIKIERLEPFEAETDALLRRVGDQIESICEYQTHIESLKVEVACLKPFKTEANDLRPKIGPLHDIIRRKEEEIVTLTDRLRDMTEERDRAGDQFSFVQQQVAVLHQQERELRNQLRAKEEDILYS